VTDHTGEAGTGTQMATHEIALQRNGQFRLDDLVLGIVSLKPDDSDPAVRLGLRRLSTDETAQVVLRPEGSVTVLGHVIEALSIDRASTPQVRLRVLTEDDAIPGDAGHL
jgi:hypothetical protein